MKTNRYLPLVILCSLLYLLSYFHRVSPAIISLDLMRDFNLSATALGVFSSSTMLAYGLMQLPSGILADLIGGRNTLLLMCALTGLGTLWFAATQSLDGAFWSRFMVGAGGAVTVPVVTVLALACPPALFTRITSMVLGTCGIGGLLAAPPLLWLSSTFGWRAAMTGFGIVSLVLCIFIILVVPGTSRQSSGQSLQGALAALCGNLRVVVGDRAYWCLSLWYMCLVGGNFCMITLWWAPYLIQCTGLSKEEVSYVMGVVAVATSFAFPLLGYLADVVFKARRMLMAVSSLCCLLALGGFMFAGPRVGFMGAVLLVSVFSACSSAPGPLAFACIKERFSPAVTGTAIGLANMTFPIWAGVLQYGYGAIYSHAQSLADNPAAAHTLSLTLLGVNLCVGMGFLYFSRDRRAVKLCTTV